MSSSIESVGPTGKSSVLIVGSHGFSLVRFRGQLIEDMLRSGHRVIAAAPDFEEQYKEELRVLGAEPLDFPLSRAGLNPIADFQSIRWLCNIIRQQKVDILFLYTLKPVAYGSIAGRLSKVPVVSLISGLGFAFSADSFKAKSIKMALTGLLRLGLKKNSAVIFQNEDDRLVLRKLKVIDQNVPTALVNGSGIDLQEFPWREPRDSQNLRFVMVARLMVEKGVLLFAEAARQLRVKWPEAEFHLVGSAIIDSPSAIHPEQLEEYIADGSLIHHGWRDDLQTILASCDVFVLPTWYREGLPRSILEALSIGLAIVTTDTPGCRKTVRPEKNGFLVRPNDLDSLIAALDRLLSSPSVVKSMSIESRSMAVELFDVRKVNTAILDILNQESSK